MHRALPASLLASWLATAAACGPPRSAADSPDAPTTDVLEQLSPEELFTRGVRFARMGDSARASEYLEAARRRGITDARVVPHLVAVLARAGRLSQARLHAAAYVRRTPSDWRMRVVLASLQHALGEPEEAIALLHAACRLAPNEPLPHYHLGSLLAEMGRPGAREAFSRYLELAPQAAHAEEAREWLAQLSPSEDERHSGPAASSSPGRPPARSTPDPQPLEQEQRP